MKKIISILCTMVLIISVFPVIAFAADEEELGPNLCLGKEAYMETMYSGYGPNRVTDGKIEGACAATKGQFTDVRSGFSNYILIDLGEVYEINRAVFRTRRDVDDIAYRNNNAIYLANKADFSDAVCLGYMEAGGGLGNDLVIDLSEPAVGRYLIACRINKTDNVFCAELEAYGIIYQGPSVGNFNDVSPNAVNAVKTVFNLGILEGISRTEFGSSYVMTRAEAAKLVYDVSNIKTGLSQYREVFKDVTAETEYAQYIITGVDRGYISQAEYFRPDDYLRGYELLKMLMHLNGLECIVNLEPFSAENVIAIATKYDLLENVSGSAMEFLSKEDIAVIVYNMLITSTVDYNLNDGYVISDVPYIETYFDRKVKRGIVTANTVTGIDSYSSAMNEGFIEVNNVIYEDFNIDKSDFLGKAVYYITDCKEEAVYYIWCDNKNTITEIVDAQDIEKADFNKISVYVGDEDKTEKFSIDEHPYIIYNDVAYSGADKTLLTQANVYIELIDNDRDSVYEIVKIYQPQVVEILSSICDETAKTIRTVGKDGTAIDCKYETLTILNSQGKTVSSDKLTEGMIIYAYISHNKKAVRYEILTNSVSGTVTSVSDNVYTIDGVEYKATKYFMDNVSTITPGTTCDFVLDANNRLVYMTKAPLNASEICGVIQYSRLLDEGYDYNEVRVFTTEGTFVELSYREDSVVLDGVKRSLEYVENLGETYFNGKLVILTVTGNSKISKMITTDYVGGDLEPVSTSIDGSYRAKSGCYSGHQLLMPINDDAIYFNVPIGENGKPLTEKEYDSRWSVQKFSDVIPVKNAEIDFTASLYGVDEYGAPKFAVKKHSYAAAATRYGTITSDSNSAMIFMYSSKIVDSNDEVCTKLYGFDIATGKEVSCVLNANMEKYVNAFKIKNNELFTDIPEGEKTEGESWIDNRLIKSNVSEYYLEDIDTLQPGDIIRYNSSGTQLELIGDTSHMLDNDLLGVVYSVGGKYTNIFAGFRLQYTKVKGIVDGCMEYSYSADVDEKLKLSDFTDAVLVVDSRTVTTYEVASAGAIVEAGDKIAIYSSSGNLKTIIIFRN